MISFRVIISFAFIYGVIADSNDIDESPGNNHQVVQTVMAGPGGDYKITVSGSASWKETITVQKTGGEKGEESHRPHHHESDKYHIEPCCDIQSNKTNNETIIIVVQCVESVKHIIKKNYVSVSEENRDKIRIMAVNCILQCVTNRLGLSSSSGVIDSEAMTEYVSSDAKEVTLGISKDMIQRCIKYAKYRSEGSSDSNDEDVCNTKSFEVFHFVKCLNGLENLYCPADHRLQSKYCESSRQRMKRRMYRRHHH